MTFSWTLFKYLSMQFLLGISIVLAMILSLVFLIDLVELLRNFSSKHGVPFNIILSLVLMKLPHLMLQVLPFALLFGAILALTRQSKNHELVVIRAAGVSVWQFLAPGLLVSFCIGVIAMTIINPVSSNLFARFKNTSAELLGEKQSSLQITEEGFWLRQGDGTSQSIVHAENANNSGAQLEAVTIWVYIDDEWKRRIDAEHAVLRSGYWLLSDANITEHNRPTEFMAELKIKTTLTKAQIQDSFASPDTLSFWHLPRFIRLTEAAGFSAAKYKMYWHSVLSLPALLCAMVLIAATVSLRLTRLGGVSRLIAFGTLAGFALYFVSDVTRALGMSGNLPVIIAAWAPTLMAMLLGMTSLFYLEDG